MKRYVKHCVAGLSCRFECEAEAREKRMNLQDVAHDLKRVLQILGTTKTMAAVWAERRVSVLSFLRSICAARNITCCTSTPTMHWEDEDHSGGSVRPCVRYEHAGLSRSGSHTA